MPVADRTSNAGVLRRVYTDKVHNQMPVRFLALQVMQRVTKTIPQGEAFFTELDAEYGEGPIASDNDDLGPAGIGRNEKAQHTYAFYKDRMRISEAHMEDARQRGGGTPVLERQTNDLIRRVRRALAYDMYRDGSGLLATIASVTNSTTAVLNVTKGVRNGMRVDVLLTASGLPGAGVSGAKISYARGTYTMTLTEGSTFADATTLAANVASYGVYRHQSYGGCLKGYDSAIATANTYGGINRALDTNDYWRGNVLTNSGTPRPISFELMQDGADLVESRTEGMVRLWYCGQRVWQQLARLAETSKQYPGNVTAFKMWATSLKVGDWMIVKDDLCPDDKMYGLDPNTWELYQNDAGGWGGSAFGLNRMQQVPDKLQFQAAYRWRLQPICHVPAANVVIQDLDFAAAA